MEARVFRTPQASARYNWAMSHVEDAYELLGVRPDADLATIRSAYRKAALRYHPDNCRVDRAEAERRFMALADAYRTAAGRFGTSARGTFADGRRWQPKDFAEMLEGEAWHFDFHDAGDKAERAMWSKRPNSQRLTFPTLNEQRCFVGLWTASVLVAAGGGIALGAIMLGPVSDDQFAWRMVVVLVCSLGTYALCIAASVYGLTLTRRVVWLVRHIGFLARRALPRKRPRELP